MSRDSRDARIAQLEGQVANLENRVRSLIAKTRQRGVEEMVSIAISEGRLLPAMQHWAVALGRRSPKALREFIAAVPPLPGPGGPLKGRK
jgi:phage I-like protein